MEMKFSEIPLKYRFRDEYDNLYTKLVPNEDYNIYPNNAVCIEGDCIGEIIDSKELLSSSLLVKEEDNKHILTNFITVRVGDKFIHNGEIMIKLPTITISNTEINAIRLKDGAFLRLNNGDSALFFR